MTVMHAMLFVLHVCVLREYEGAWVTAMRVWGPEWCGFGECVYGWYRWFRCLSCACDVLEMNVVRGVGGVSYMCMCLARCRVGGERLGPGRVGWC